MQRNKKNKKPLPKEDGSSKIINAALELFALKGYAQTSVDSIALRAKISKGLIYYYFKSKQDILKGIFDTVMVNAEELFQNKGKLSPREFLGKLVDFSFAFINNKKKYSRLVMALIVQPEVAKGLNKEMKHVRERWFAAIREAFEGMGYKNADTEVYLFCAILDGAGIGYQSIPAYPLNKVKALIEKRYELR